MKPNQQTQILLPSVGCYRFFLESCDLKTLQIIISPRALQQAWVKNPPFHSFSFVLVYLFMTKSYHSEIGF